MAMNGMCNLKDKEVLFSFLLSAGWNVHRMEEAEVKILYHEVEAIRREWQSIKRGVWVPHTPQLLV